MKSLLVGVVWAIIPMLLTSCQGETRPPSEDQIDARPGIAVLPFDNLSADPDDADFADALHEELLVRLSQSPDLLVVSRRSVLEYVDQRPSLAQITSELGVRHILEGSVRISESRVRIVVQLIDGATEEHLWSESFDRELTAESLFAIQEAVATQIGESVVALLVAPPSSVEH
jgi:adenylate cyclase